MTTAVISGPYVGSALGGSLHVGLTEDEVREMWDATDEDLREVDEKGEITLWARSTDGTFRLAPIYFRPLTDAL